MLYTELTIDNKVYKLRLNTRNTIALEDKLGCNPLAILGTGDTIPTVSTMVTVLHYSLQQYQHSISLEDTYNIFDKYLEDNTMTDFIPVILEIYKVSGLVKLDEETAEEPAKN